MFPVPPTSVGLKFTRNTIPIPVCLKFSNGYFAQEGNPVNDKDTKYIEQQMDESDLQSNASNSKRKQNAPQVLKVCPRDCFVISTTRNATANPRYRFGPNSEVYLKTKNNRELMKKFLLGL